MDSKFLWEYQLPASCDKSWKEGGTHPTEAEAKRDACDFVEAAAYYGPGSERALHGVTMMGWKLKVDTRPHCNNGWKAIRGGDYTGGHYCKRLAGHKGRCICTCGRRAKNRPESEKELPR